MSFEMSNELRDHIAEVYDGGCWDNVTQIMWRNGQPFQLRKFVRDVEFDGANWRCIIVERVVYDDRDITAVDYAEDIFAEAWKL